MGRKPKPVLRKMAKRKRAAYHEAAHAVVSYRTAGFAGGNVSIVPRKMEDWVRLGYASDGWSDSFNPEHMEATILSCYAGGHAQREIDPSWGAEGCGQDDEDADEQMRLHGWEKRSRITVRTELK